MDRGYCDYGLFKALDAKGVVFVTRLKTNWQFKRIISIDRPAVGHDDSANVTAANFGLIHKF